MKRSTLTIDHRNKTRGLGIPFMSRYIENDYNLMTNTTTDILSKGDYLNNNISKPSTATAIPPLRVRSLTGTVDDESTSKGADGYGYGSNNVIIFHKNINKKDNSNTECSSVRVY